MLFRRYHFAGFLCRSQYQFFIQRLNRMNVDHFCLNAVSRKFLCCFQRAGHTGARCNDCYIFAFSEQCAFADFKLIVRVIIDHRHCRTAKTKIYRTFKLNRCFHSRLCFHIIGRYNNSHTGNGSHQCNIFITLMGCAVFTYCDTCMGCADFYIQVRITDGVSYLLKIAPCCEHGK